MTLCRGRLIEPAEADFLILRLEEYFVFVLCVFSLSLIKPTEEKPAEFGIGVLIMLDLEAFCELEIQKLISLWLISSIGSIVLLPNDATKKNNANNCNFKRRKKSLTDMNQRRLRLNLMHYWSILVLT